LVLFIFALVVGAGRVGKLGEAIGGALGKREKKSDDPRIAVRERDGDGV
jgi:Sec-independent protein translocase protein TatA